MIDYITAARRLRRLLSKLKDQDPELSRIADILERLGLRHKTEHPVKQVFREAGKLFRDLDVTANLEAFIQELAGDQQQSERPEPAEEIRQRLSEALSTIDRVQKDHQASLVILKATQNERDDLKRQLEAMKQERDAWKRSYDAVFADSQLSAGERILGDPDYEELQKLVQRYCAAVLDPTSLTATERLGLFHKLLSKVSP